MKIKAHKPKPEDFIAVAEFLRGKQNMKQAYEYLLQIATTDMIRGIK